MIMHSFLMRKIFVIGISCLLIVGGFLIFGGEEASALDGDIHINEYLPDPGGGQDWDGDGTPSETYDDEFIEIYNIGTSEWGVGDWTIEDADGKTMTIASGVTIPADGCIYFVCGDKPGAHGGSPWSGTWPILNNGGDTITLKNSMGTQIDQETYSSSTDGSFWACNPDGTGTWSKDDTPSPGLKNGQEIPEFSTLLIPIIGMIASFAIFRKIKERKQ